MADNNLYNNNDSLDISELASLNQDISNELIEQLQQKVMQEANNLNPGNDDSTLFEEPADPNDPSSIENLQKEQQKEEFKLDTSFDDNFIKKYKAKLNKQAMIQNIENKSEEATENNDNDKENSEQPIDEKAPIEKITNGNITERIITKEQKQYNDSLDFLDNNIKYSKYVIYIDPQNVDFIESLTVKERKNLINNVLKQQNDIKLSKQRFKFIQGIIMHVIIAILTVTLFIPIIYHVINASLEASIDNYRRSQTNIQILYKEKGKIKNINK